MQDSDNAIFASTTLQALFPRARVQSTIDSVEAACPSSKLSHLILVIRAVAEKLFRAMDASVAELAEKLERLTRAESASSTPP